MAVSQHELWLTILGMAIVTFATRFLPLVMVAGRQLPAAVTEFLGFVPVAVLGALLCASLGAGPQSMSVAGFDLRFLLSSVPAFLIAVRYRSIMGTVVAGVVTALWLRTVLG